MALRYGVESPTADGQNLAVRRHTTTEIRPLLTAVAMPIACQLTMQGGVNEPFVPVLPSQTNVHVAGKGPRVVVL